MDEPTRGYEFDASENLQLHVLHQRMRFLSYTLMLGGSVVMVSGVTMAANLAFSEVPVLWPMAVLLMGAGGLLLILLGLFLQRSARSFHEIVATQGADIAHLMRALDQMRRVFELSIALVVIMTLVLLGALAVVLGPATPPI